MDAVAALARLLDRRSDREVYRIAMTFAGGVAPEVEHRFAAALEQLHRKHGQHLLRVERLGHVSGRDKARCFEKADLFLSPSRWESFGLTVVEAMAWGVPIVAAASDGVRGILPAGYEWLASPGDDRNLAQVLRCGCEALVEGRGYLIGGSLRSEFILKFQEDVFRRTIRQVLARACDH